MIPDVMVDAEIDLLLEDFGEEVTWQQPDLSLSEDTDLLALVNDAPESMVPPDRGPTPLIDKTFSMAIADLPAGWNAETALIVYDGSTYRPTDQVTEGPRITFPTRRIT